MKKILLGLTISAFVTAMYSIPAYATYYQAPNGGNMNFYPLMQHQMEKEETLDFVNDPEHYKEKREQKDAQLDYQEGKTDVNPYFKPTSFNLKGSPSQSQDQTETQTSEPMQFMKDSNGQIRIQGMQ